MTEIHFIQKPMTLVRYGSHLNSAELYTPY